MNDKTDKRASHDDLNDLNDLSPGHVQARWKHLFSFADRTHVWIIVIAIFLSVTAGIVIPALAYLLGRIFDLFAAYATGRVSSDIFSHKISRHCLYLVCLGAANCLLNGGFFGFWIAFGELQAKSARQKLYDAMLHKEIAWYDTRKCGMSTMIPRLQTQIRDFQLAVSQPFGFALQYTVTLVASLALAMYSAWDLSLITIASLPIGALFVSWVSRRTQPTMEAQAKELDSASKIFSNAALNIEMVKCFNGQNTELWSYLEATKRAAKHYLRVARGNALQIGVVRTLVLTMFVQGFWYGDHIVGQGRKTPGDVLTAFWACLIATQTIEQLLPQMIVLEKGRSAGTLLVAALTTIQRGKRLSEATGGKSPRFCEGDITFTNVCFIYPSRPNSSVLDSVSLFFPAGETTFVLGRSGSGKSTLCNLLLRFYTQSKGTILVDGHNLQELDISWLRNNITVVQQQTLLFNDTIFGNIALGHSEHDRIRKEETKASVELAGLIDTILDLPDGLDTRIGHGGSLLSGGQRQRIALARARLRNTAVLILDEATNALDQSSKQKVMDAIRSWRKGKTTIIITHDVSQMGQDDYAYVIDEGRVIEEGYRRNLVEKSSFITKHCAAGDMAVSAATSRPTSSGRSRHRRLLSDVEESPGISTYRPVSRASGLDENLIAATMARPPIPDATMFPRRSRAMSIIPMTQMGRVTNARNSIASYQASSPALGSLPIRANIPGLDVNQEPSEADLRLFRSPPTASRRPDSSLKRLSSIFTESHHRHGQESYLELKHTTVTNETSTSALGKKHQRRVLPLQQIINTVWPSLSRSDRWSLLGGYLFAIVHAVSTPTFSWVFSRLLSTFFTPGNDNSREALKWSMIVLGVAFIDGISSYYMHYLLEKAGQAWIDSIRADATQRILDQPKEWFDSQNDSIQGLVLCLDRSAEEMRNLIGRFSGFILVAAMIIITALVWCLIICWKLTLVGMAAGPVLYAITQGFEMLSGRWEGRSNAAGEATAAVFTETFNNIKTIRALTLEYYFHRKYDSACLKAVNIGFKRAFLSGFFFGITDGSVLLHCALIFWYGSVLATAGLYSVQSVITVITMLMFSIAGANAVVAFIPQINSSRDTASQLLALARLPLRESYEHKGQLRIDHLHTPEGPSAVVFDNVSFRYPSRPTHQVLSGVSFSVPLKTLTVLVGTSGSGKSTLIALLLGLYPLSRHAPAKGLILTEPSRRSSLTGSILIGRHPLSSLHLSTFRSLIGYVRQQTALFPGTIRSNIIYGLPEDSPLATTASIGTAATLAGIDSFIDSLPQGYSTLVGEGGTALSGGQIQRVAIARALVRQPELLILDEPTSSLDPEGAAWIRDSLKRLVTGGVTVIVVTHGVEMMKTADRVVVLEDGRVAEQGRYDDLMALGKGRLKALLSDGDDLA